MRTTSSLAGVLALLATLVCPHLSRLTSSRSAPGKPPRPFSRFSIRISWQRTMWKVFPFTNPADQKTALLAGSLDMTGTTLAHAIQSAVMGQPVVVVAALCNKCSALVVRKDGPVQTDRRSQRAKNRLCARHHARNPAA